MWEKKCPKPSNTFQKGPKDQLQTNLFLGLLAELMDDLLFRKLTLLLAMANGMAVAVGGAKVAPSLRDHLR